MLYSQVDNDYGRFESGGWDPLHFIVDDFTVPTGTQWTVTQFSFQTVGPTSPWSYSLAVYKANAIDPTVPGAEISVQSFAPADVSFAGDFMVITLPEPVTLQPGGYWIGVDGYLVRTRTPPTGQRAASNYAGHFVPIDNPFGPEPLDLVFSLIGTAQMPATPAAVVGKFDELAVSGGLTAQGPGKSAPNRFKALLNMLVTASALYDSGDVAGACSQLGSAAKRVHTQGKMTASHFASGTSAAELITVIDDVRARICT